MLFLLFLIKTFKPILSARVNSRRFRLGSFTLYFKIFKTKKISKFKIKDPNLKHLELTLADKIGLNVLIKNNKNNKGSITLEYKNLEQLNKLIEIIKFNY